MGNKSLSTPHISNTDPYDYLESYSCVREYEEPNSVHAQRVESTQSSQSSQIGSLELPESSADFRLCSGIVLEACIKTSTVGLSIALDNESAHNSGVVYREPHWKWPNGEIPYEIDDEIQTDYPDMNKNINEAIQRFHLSTTITFKERRRADTNWLVFKYHATETNSHVGRQNRRQTVNLQSSVKPGHIMHEIMHVLGFHHEHSRVDRDNYVKIDIHRMTKDFAHNYRKEGYPLGNYDPDSIMHYGTSRHMKADFKSSKKMGQRETFSKGDLNAISYIYSTPRCTYDIFKEEYFVQTYYECTTCWGPESNYGVCEFCASRCHRGHMMVRHDYTEMADEKMKFVCDCGRNKHTLEMCTKESTGNKYVKQLMYVCTDCLDVEKYKKMKSGKQRGICYPCIKKCHTNHNIEKIGIVDATCDCGKKKCGVTCSATINMRLKILTS